MAVDLLLVNAVNLANIKNKGWIVGIIISWLIILYQYFVLNNKDKKNKALYARLQEVLQQKDILATENKILKSTMEDMGEKFKSLSSDTLTHQTNHFIKIINGFLDRFQNDSNTTNNAQERKIDMYMDPIKELMKQLKQNIAQLDNNHKEDRIIVKEQINNIVQVAQGLKVESAKMINSFFSSNVKGTWGEMKLKRLVEVSGMQEYCDFFWQQDKGLIRPDMIIKLPKSGIIIVDSKVPLSAYMKGMEALDERDKKRFMTEHVKQVKNHITSLQQKKYWEVYEDSADFVVLFLPAESFLSTALEINPDLIEFSTTRNIIIATPITLMALLKTIAYGWKNLNITQDLENIKNRVFNLENLVVSINTQLDIMAKCLEKSNREFFVLDDVIRNKIGEEIKGFSMKKATASDKELKEETVIDSQPTSSPQTTPQ